MDFDMNYKRIIFYLIDYVGGFKIFVVSIIFSVREIVLERNGVMKVFFLKGIFEMD